MKEYYSLTAGVLSLSKYSSDGNYAYTRLTGFKGSKIMCECRNERMRDVLCCVCCRGNDNREHKDL